MKIISSFNGPYPASIEQQKYLCFVDDGILYVSDEYRTNPHVLAYCHDLEKTMLITKSNMKTPLK